MEQEYETIDLREIFLLLRKNFILIFVSTVVLAIAGYLFTAFFIVPEYEASATMIVNSREDITPQQFVTIDQINSAKQLVDTYSVILKSDTVLDNTIRDLSLNIPYEKLEKKVTVSAVNSTQVMKITVRDKDAQVAKRITQSIVDQAPDIIKKTAKTGSVEVISAPKANDKPASPNKVLNTALAGFLGLVLSLTVVFLKNIMNNKMMTDLDITKKLGIPVLGVIPQIEIKS